MAETPLTVKFFGPASQAAEENPSGGLGQTVQDPFWVSTDVDNIRTRWNELWPYQLLVLERVDGQYSVKNSVATFTLPMPPQQLTIDMPFATDFSITMGGAIEQHNGAPIRNISLSGNTGILPLTNTTGIANTLSFGQAIFAGTLSGANQITQTIGNATSLLGVEGTTPPNVHQKNEFTDGVDKNRLAQSTGFYQFLLLERFLEDYAAIKKTESGRDYRLALAIWKEDSVYLLKMNNLVRQRSAASPHKYNYTLNAIAWKRIPAGDTSFSPAYTTETASRDPNVFAKVLNTLGLARDVLAGAQTTLKGLRADIQNVLFRPLREAILLGKDTLGIVTTAVDFPGDIIKDLREPLLELAGGARSFGNDLTNAQLGRRGRANASAAVQSIEEAFRQLAIETSKAETGSGNTVKATKEGGLTGGGSNRGGTGGNPNANNAATPNKVLDTPEDNFDFFKTVQLGSLNIRPSTIRKIEAERRRVRNLRREDFEYYRDSTLSLMATFAASVGATSDMYNQTFDVQLPTSSKASPSDDDWDILYSLNQVAAGFDALSLSAEINNTTLDSMEYVAGLASRSGIAFRVPKSKFAVPFPHGDTLEQLSERYLGSPDRWLEIATLNGLQSPYVDELGWTKNLLTNGNGNQIVVDDATNMFVGQLVYVGSRTVRREKRRVQKIQVLGNQTIISLDGLPDLQKYSVIASAYVQGFLPNTVNSQQTIFIPSDTEPEEEDYRIKKIPGVDYFDPLVKSGGIDLLLDQDGDLIVTPDGDTRLAVGLNNFIQRIKLVFGTKKGSLIRHPEYGLGIKYGTSVADISAQDILAEARRLLSAEPGISGVESASIKINGNSMSIRIAVTLAATNQTIPVELDNL